MVMGLILSWDTIKRVLLGSGCLQIQPNKFPGDFQDPLIELPVDFLH